MGSAIYGFLLRQLPFREAVAVCGREAFVGDFGASNREYLYFFVYSVLFFPYLR